MSDQEKQEPQPFSEDALTETRIVQERITTALKDRPEVNGITLNSPLTKACDIAFWLERTPQGGYTLFVSMVDVASFISRHTTSALDREARKRAFAHYTTEKTFIPLFPETLSEGNLSLLEGQPCPTLTLALPLDVSYHVGEPSFQQTAVSLSKRLTYEEADQERTDPAAVFSWLFQDAYHVALGLWHERIRQGALTSYELEQGWVMTEDGVRILLDPDKRYPAYLIEQEFLILANQTIASFLAARALPALYRNHRVTVPPTKAIYAPDISGHGGLNVPVYMHALFPLRSYPDLINQRILLAHLRGEPSPYTVRELEELALPLNAQEGRIKAEKRGYFRGAYEEQLQKEREEESLATLDQKRFHTVLRKAAEEQQLTPEIVQEISRRLDLELLKDNDLYTLVFRFPNTTEEWQPIKEAVFAFLQEHPSYAAMLLNRGQQQGKWIVLGYEQPLTFGSFQVNVSLEYEGKTYTSSWQTAGKRERAKQLAIVDVLATIAGVALSSPKISSTEAHIFLPNEEDGTERREDSRRE
jgi:ribonuclease R